MNEFDYIVVYSFMVNKLKLSGNALLVYAIIYGFSKDGKSEYYGSQDYLANCLGLSTRGIGKILKTLVEQDLITKRVKGNFCIYSVNLDYIPKYKVLIDKEQSSDNNNTSIYINNNTNNSLLFSEQSSDKPKTSYFTKPTIEEIENYIKENNYSVDSGKFYNHYEANGWMVGRTKMKSWQAAIRYWNTNSSGYNNYSKNSYNTQLPKVVKNESKLSEKEHKHRWEIIQFKKLGDLNDFENIIKPLFSEQIAELEKQGKKFTYADYMKRYREVVGIKDV